MIPGTDLEERREIPSAHGGDLPIPDEVLGYSPAFSALRYELQISLAPRSSGNNKKCGSHGFSLTNALNDNPQNCLDFLHRKGGPSLIQAEATLGCGCEVGCTQEITWIWEKMGCLKQSSTTKDLTAGQPPSLLLELEITSSSGHC
jgi:hypothetical protein